MKRLAALLIVTLMGLGGPGCFGEAVAAESEVQEIGEVVVTATRHEEEVTSVPANVTVIAREEMEESTAQTIPDLLRNTMGVQVSDITGNKKSFTVDLRGFGETAAHNTLVLVDGRRVNQADLSGVDWTQIPLNRVEKIEIIRGGRGAVLYGDNATGGVINIITRGEEKFLQTGLNLVAGSYETWKADFYRKGAIRDLSYALSGSYVTSDGYRDNSETEMKDFGLDISYYPVKWMTFDVSGGYHEDSARLPGDILESDFAAGSVRTDSLTPDDFADVEDRYLKGGGELTFWDGSFVRLDASYRERTALSFSSAFWGSFTGDTTIKTLTFGPRAVIDKEVAGLEQTLSLGFDYERITEDILNDSSFSGIAFIPMKRKNYGYYLHEELVIVDNLTLSGGYRYNRSDFDFPTGTPSEVTTDEESYTAAANYRFLGHSHVYVSFSRSFRYPVLDEYFSFLDSSVAAGLLPQVSDNVEVGIRHDITDAITAQVNYFDIDTESEIFFNSTAFANENLDGTTKRHGVEVSLTARPLDRVTIAASYTYLDAEVEGGQFSGKEIPGVAKRKATASVLVNPWRGLSLALYGRYVGKRPFISDFDNAFGRQDDYTVVDTKLSYAWDKVTAFVTVNNVTDELYSEYGVLGGFPLERAFYPSPERNYLAGLRADW